MTLTKDSGKPLEAQYEQEHVASTSNTAIIDPPPPFTHDFPAHRDDLLSTSGLLDDLVQPPPEFAPYNAEYFEVENGDILSHDSHLNTDGAYTMLCFLQL